MPSKQLALWVDKVFLNDEIFNPASPYNLDDRLSTATLLKERLAEYGWDCHTADFYQKQAAVPDAVLFLDLPAEPVSSLTKDWGNARKLAVLFECDVIKPQNWEMLRHADFDAIFTWNEALVDNKKYFKINFSQRFPAVAEPRPVAREKFCVLIAGNKKSSHPLELYSERVKTIRWFEKHHPLEFDLYGIGWDRRMFAGPLPVRALNRVPFLSRLLAPRFPSYRGEAADKRKLLGSYKFSICYENAREIGGYITEKIFDCIKTGCIPVYWGAPDITKYVPADCFIDKRDFKSHEELYAFMGGMGDAERARRLAAMSVYLSGGDTYQFSDEYFAKAIAAVLTGALGGAGGRG